jgi:hypothetical protein
VSVPSNADVDDFRDAVQDKWDKPGYLDVIPAGVLIVYKNKAAFDNRKAAKGKEVPLKSSEPLHALGTMEEKALFVAVPQSLLTIPFGQGVGRSGLETTSVHVRDISKRLYEKLTQPFTSEPTLDQLKQVLSSEPLAHIPLYPNQYDDLKSSFRQFDDERFSKFFYSSVEESIDLSHLLTDLAWMPISLNHSGESELHYYVDTFMKRILMGILGQQSIPIHVTRNNADSSFTTIRSQLRPDFLFYVDSFLILRGEEKRSSFELVDAKKELTDKLTVWNPVLFGNLNYIFGFACAGEFFQFYAMGPNTVMATEISEVFDLSKVSSRYELFFCIINLARVIKTIRKRIPKTSIMMFNPVKRLNGVTIEITNDSVIKTIPVLEPDRMDFLTTLYAVMKENSVPFVCQCRSLEIISKKGRYQGTFIQLTITPLGCEFIPPTLDLLLKALRCVLQALEGVHKLDYAHADVRWANILRVSDDYWVLIDFENAVKGNETLFQEDIRMVGRLIGTCESLMTMALSMFRNKLVSNAPPSAANALKLLADLSHEVAEEMK